MSETTTATRVETVTANIEAVIEKYGDEAYNRIMSVCLQDISLSLAMLVDGGTTTEGD
jgi:hypothetical protein